MKNKVVEVPPIQVPIRPSPGFKKKGLSEFKLDLMALCGFGCRYCSSNEGNYLRINREEFARLTQEQLGYRVFPSEDPTLAFIYQDVLERLRAQLHGAAPRWGARKTLVFSMLTDAFSPLMLERGVTEEALRLVLERTEFRVRVMTKNAIVGTDRWIDFFKGWPGRLVVGLSIGTLDDAWARRIEVGCSLPSARLRALHNLQQAGVPTYLMLCPCFPDVLEGNGLEDLIDRSSPDQAEHVWAEPYNDRGNWKVVRGGYEPGSYGFTWLSKVYEQGRKDVWSRYAADLYTRLRAKAERQGWMSKLRFLLYEDLITEQDAPSFGRLEGVWLQSKPGRNGKSRNPHIAALQLARRAPDLAQGTTEAQISLFAPGR